jgi:hypothetical protein
MLDGISVLVCVLSEWVDVEHVRTGMRSFLCVSNVMLVSLAKCVLARCFQ